ELPRAAVEDAVTEVAVDGHARLDRLHPGPRRDLVGHRLIDGDAGGATAVVGLAGEAGALAAHVSGAAAGQLIHAVEEDEVALPGLERLVDDVELEVLLGGGREPGAANHTVLVEEAEQALGRGGGVS